MLVSQTDEPHVISTNRELDSLLSGKCSIQVINYEAKEEVAAGRA
jgi:hypothetical protein